MADITDADRINLLPGMLRQAALLKAQRPAVLDAQTAAALGGGAPAGAAAPMAPPASAPPGAMSQSQFGGAPVSPEIRLLQQKKLAEMLRSRGY